LFWFDLKILILFSSSLVLHTVQTVIVYRYYYYNRLKQRSPHMSFWEQMRWTWRWTFLGPLPENFLKGSSASDNEADEGLSYVDDNLDFIPGNYLNDTDLHVTEGYMHYNEDNTLVNYGEFPNIIT
jgi:hypothetical protein